MIEMIVVVAIFLITTGIVLGNFKGFTRKSSLDLLAREMSLIIRQAQVYGTATRRYEGTVVTGENKFPSYGVYAKKGANFFFIFGDKDIDKDGYYDAMSDNCDKTQGCIEQFNLYGGAFISDIKGVYSSGIEESITEGCNPAQGDLGLQITFPRPTPNAKYMIGKNDGEASGCHNADYSYAKITVEDPVTMEKRYIDIWRTGHIYVESELN